MTERKTPKKPHIRSHISRNFKLSSLFRGPFFLTTIAVVGLVSIGYKRFKSKVHQYNGK